MGSPINVMLKIAFNYQWNIMTALHLEDYHILYFIEKMELNRGEREIGM